MIYYHTEEVNEIDLTRAIYAHSGDLTVTYKTVFEEDLSLSYYFPEGYQTADKTFPTIILIHGGGWNFKKIFPDQNGVWQGDYLGFLARYFAQKGFISVSVDYRLIQDKGQKAGYQIIDCVDDCMDAVDYILRNADVHKIDTQCVYLLGESAGGHLAGMLATQYQFGDFQFKTTFLFNSILNLETDDKRKDRIPQESAHPSLKDIPIEARARYLSPEKAIHHNMRPVVLFHGDCDTTVDKVHSESFYNTMKNLGLPCQMHIMNHAQHAFLLAEYTSQIDICKSAISILEKILC